jgi:uncharacterized protein (TIGR03083 family)
MAPPNHDEIVRLIRAERTALVSLLVELDAAAWTHPTACPGWSVKDVAAHILGGDFRILSSERDSFVTPNPRAAEGWAEVVALVNANNLAWVEAWRDVSPPLVTSLLAWSGPQLWEHFRGQDPDALGGPVSWAGDEPAPNWLRIAREFTERWVHQQHIRAALNVPGLDDESWVGPVLATFAHSLPRALRTASASDGTIAKLIATGAGGGSWTVIRRDRRWSLDPTAAGGPAVTVRISADRLWRLYTKGIGSAAARKAAEVEGSAELGEAILSAVAVIA